MLPLLMTGSGHAETLEQLLMTEKIPLRSFRVDELKQSVNGATQSDQSKIVVAYRTFNPDNIFVGPPQVIRYEKVSGQIEQRRLPIGETDGCAGAPDEVAFVDEFILVSISISPSAECTFVLNQRLVLHQILYGFRAARIAPGRIVLIEDMIHFAPVHPERLQVVDLRSGKTAELYPSLGDALRQQLTHENAQKMPPQATCREMNDPCSPGQFDEDIRSLASDGNGKLALIVVQSVSHALEKEQPPETMASQTALYLYQYVSSGWQYCEEEIDDSEIERLDQELKANFEKVATRCTPHLRVIPDMTTAHYNPFLTR